jgi:hypothetical protein
MPSSANAKSGVVVWLQAPLTDRLDVVGGCATVKPAPLALVYVADLTSPAVAQTSIILSSDTSAATRPPALVPVDLAHGILMAAPFGPDVGVWLLTPTALQSGSLPAPTHLSALRGAHEIAAATNVAGGAVSIALAASVGCHPAASVEVVLGKVDPSSGAFTFGAPLEVAPKGNVATQPSVAWVPARGGEWWVSWIDSGPHEHIQRLGADGKPIGAPVDINSQFLTGAVSTGGSLFGLDPGTESGSFVEIPIGCGS